MLCVTIDGDAGIGRLSGVDIEADFGDILDSFDLGGFLIKFKSSRVEGSRSRLERSATIHIRSELVERELREFY